MIQELTLCQHEMGNTAASSVDFQIDCNTFRPVCSNTLHFCQTSKPPVRQGVEPTNNANKRSLRHAVIWRKLSFGTQSANGSRFVEPMLTVIETCRQQSRDVLAYVTQTKAHSANEICPSPLSNS